MQVEVSSIQFHFTSPFLSHQFSQSNQSAGPQINTPWPETAVLIHSETCFIKSEPVWEWMHPGLCACAYLFRWGLWWGRLMLTQSISSTRTVYQPHSCWFNEQMWHPKSKGCSYSAALTPPLHPNRSFCSAVCMKCPLLMPAFIVFKCICKCCTPKLLHSMLHLVLYLTTYFYEW